MINRQPYGHLKQVFLVIRVYFIQVKEFTS